MSAEYSQLKPAYVKWVSNRDELPQIVVLLTELYSGEDFPMNDAMQLVVRRELEKYINDNYSKWESEARGIMAL